MKRSDFARLLGCSASLLTKWGKEGLLVEHAVHGVDAAATLEKLAGVFDESRRTAAIDRLAKLDQPLSTPANDAPAPRAMDPGQIARTQRDMIDAQMKRLDLQARAGQLVDRDSVEDLLADACRKLQAQFDAIRRDTTNIIMQIPADAETRRAQINAAIRDSEARALQAFADDCARIAAAASETETLPETPMEMVR